MNHYCPYNNQRATMNSTMTQLKGFHDKINNMAEVFYLYEYSPCVYTVIPLWMVQTTVLISICDPCIIHKEDRPTITPK